MVESPYKMEARRYVSSNTIIHTHTHMYACKHTGTHIYTHAHVAGNIKNLDHPSSSHLPLPSQPPASVASPMQVILTRAPLTFPALQPLWSAVPNPSNPVNQNSRGSEFKVRFIPVNSHPNLCPPNNRIKPEGDNQVYLLARKLCPTISPLTLL